MEAVMVSPDEKRSVLSHRHSINERIESLLQSIQKGCSLAQIEHEAVAVRRHISGFEEYLSKTIEPHYYAEHRKQDCTIAMEVFKIPELFELIAQNLDDVDLMGCYPVCRTFRDTIENSTKLQMNLFQRADSKSKPMVCQIPPSSRTSFRACKDEGVKLFGTIDIAGYDGKDQLLPTIGSRWKKMLLTQPPIHNVLFSPARCVPDGQACAAKNAPNIKRLVQSDTGVTFGDICDKAEELFQPHKNCSSGPLSLSYSEREKEFEIGM